jgi:hypothetical protein
MSLERHEEGGAVEGAVTEFSCRDEVNAREM